MPYPSYKYMAEEDVKAIIAYIKTLKPHPNVVPESEPNFPFSVIMNFIPSKAEPTEKPNPADSIAYGKYVTTIAGCIDCHTPYEGGQPVEGKEFAGGRDFPFVDGSIVRSSNITPDEQTGIGSWSKKQFIERFKFYEGKDTIEVAAGEFNSYMPWTMYAGMTKEDLGAIYTYLMTIEQKENKVVRFTAAK
jgi:hypothetical protein